jgi:hypothetical protein
MTMNPHRFSILVPLALILPVTIAVSVGITQLYDQSYYAASMRTMLDEIADALSEGEPAFGERFETFRKSQRLTYESRDNLLENVRRFRDEGKAIRATRSATQPTSQERMILNVSLSMHSVNHFNRLALAHPFFDRPVTAQSAGAPMADLNWTLCQQIGISIHAFDGAGDKPVTVDATDRPLRDILLELGDACGFLYEAALSPEGEVYMLFLHNVEPLLRGPDSGTETPLPEGTP